MNPSIPSVHPLPAEARVRARRFNHDFLPALIFLLPGLVLFLLFFLGPMGYSLRISFYDWRIAHPEQSEWVGLENYLRALSNPVFRRSVLNTLSYTVITVAGQMALGLIIALLLNQKLRGRTFFRVSYYLPVISSWVILSLLFEYMFNGQAGLVNYLLKEVLHLTRENIRWLADPILAFVPLNLLGIWKGVGWTCIIYLAGLQSIPEPLYEAAAVDGAGRFDKLRFITLPLLRPTLVYLLVVLVIGGLNAYIPFLLITGGDPLDKTHSMLTLMYETTFAQLRFGSGAAISYLLTLLVLFISLVQLKLLRKPLEV